MSSDYEAVPQYGRNSTDDSEGSESAPIMHSGEKTPQYQAWSKRNKSINVFHWVGHGFTVLILAAFIFHNISIRRHAPETPSPPYSPADDFVKDSPYVSIFQNSFWIDSPHKGPPTKEVLDQWEHITSTGPPNITADEMTKLGRSLDAVQYPPELGGVSYIAYLESAHQLHCLQALWEDHHFAKYPELFPILAEKKATQPVITEKHFEHCVDVIRNRLMCTADSQLVTFRWVEKVSGPYPYFNTPHMCNNYEKLLDWDKTRQPEPAKTAFLKTYPFLPPADAVKLQKAP